MESHVPESIAEKRLKKNRIEYLVKWTDFAEADNTWEARVDLINEGHKQVIDVFEKTGPPTAKELKEKMKQDPSRGRTRTPRRTRRGRSKTPVRRRSGRKPQKIDRFDPSLPPQISQSSRPQFADEETEENADESDGNDESAAMTAQSSEAAAAEGEGEGEGESAADGAKEGESAAAVSDDDNAAAKRVMFSDVAKLGNLWTGFLILMALASATLHLVLQHILANEDLISHKTTTLRAAKPQLVMGLLLVTRVLPTVLAFWTVRSAGNNPKNYSRSAYITFLDIALIWCVATDVIEQLVVNVDKTDVGNSQLVVICASILVQLALVIAFSSEHRDAGQMPQMRPELMVAATAGAIAIIVSMGSKGQGLGVSQCKPEVVAIIVAAFAAMWRAAARVGYGHDNTYGYGTLSQWLGLLGVMALAVSNGLRLCAFGEFGTIVGLSASMLETARLANYWISLSALTGSAVAP